MKKIGIIGSGIVGQVLAKGFSKYGYEVMIGTNDPSKHEDLKQKTKVTIGTFNETAKFGEMLVLAVKGSAAEAALERAGGENLKGKIIIDTTNPIADTPPVNGVIRYFTTADDSLMERLQKAYSETHFVKAFNSVGNAFMVDPDFGGTIPTMFICGNEESAKVEVKGILDQFGWETEDLGKVNAAGVIESLCILWCIPGMLRNQWSHAFKLLRK